MLSCLLDGQYKEASKSLNRKLDFRCPQCNRVVILKAGSKNIPHFSHRSDSDCKHGLGETLWHRKGKNWVASYYRSEDKDYDVKFEQIFGNRRTDALVTTKEGKKIAFEFQLKDEGSTLYTRTNDLLIHVDEVVWVLPWKVTLTDKRYRATATYGINALYSENEKKRVKAKVMFYDSKDDVLFICKKRPWELYVEETDFGGGYYRKSKRWCELKVLEEFKNAKEE